MLDVGGTARRLHARLRRRGAGRPPERRHRRDAAAGHARRARRAPATGGRCGGSTARAPRPSTRSRRRRARWSPRAAGRHHVRTLRGPAASAAHAGPGARRRLRLVDARRAGSTLDSPCSRRWGSRARPSSTSAARTASCASCRAALRRPGLVPRGASTARPSAPPRDGRATAARPARAAGRRPRGHLRPRRPDRPLGPRAACSSSPRPATCPCAGRAAPACANLRDRAARRRRRPTTRSRSSPRRPARCSAARARAGRSRSTCERDRDDLERPEGDERRRCRRPPASPSRSSSRFVPVRAARTGRPTRRRAVPRPPCAS